MIYVFAWLAIVVVCAVVSLFGSITATLGVCIALSIFQASAAAKVGHAWVQPGSLAIVFLLARMGVEMLSPQRLSLALEAIVRNLPIVLFALYAAVTAYILPHLFQGSMEVYPMTDPYEPRVVLDLLYPSSQNVTQTIYILFSMLFAIATTYAFIHTKSLNSVLPIVLVAAILEDFIASAQAVIGARGGLLDWKFIYSNQGAVIENGQRVGSFLRLNGTFIEPSSLGTFLPAMAAFLLTAYLMDRRRAVCGLGGLWSVAVSVASMSTTAYVGLVAMAASVLLVATVAERGRHLPFALSIAGITTICALLIAAVVMLLFPGALHGAQDIIDKIVVNKLGTDSGKERSQWSAAAYEVLFKTDLLGVGTGAIKTSGLVPLLLGSTGVIGFGLFAWYLVSLFRAPVNGANASVAAAAKAGLITIVLTMCSSAGELTSLAFWLFAGVVACGLQRAPSPAGRGVRSAFAARGQSHPQRQS